MPSKAGRRAAIIALAVPAVVLAGTPAFPSDGTTTINSCWLDRTSGSPALYASFTVQNKDPNNAHDYTTDLTFSSNGKGLGTGFTSVDGVPPNGAGKSDARAPLVTNPSGASDVSDGKVTCKWVTKDDAGELVDKGTWPHVSTRVPPSPTYRVVSGDTLSGIAEQQCGDASQWRDIYDANRDTIEAAARDHGRPDSDNGHWIYPGTDLVITC